LCSFTAWNQTWNISRLRPRDVSVVHLNIRVRCAWMSKVILSRQPSKYHSCMPNLIISCTIYLNNLTSKLVMNDRKQRYPNFYSLVGRNVELMIVANFALHQLWLRFYRVSNWSLVQQFARHKNNSSGICYLWTEGLE